MLFSYDGLFQIIYTIVSEVAYYLDSNQLLQVSNDVQAHVFILIATISILALLTFSIILILKGCYYVYKLFRGLF